MRFSWLSPGVHHQSRPVTVTDSECGFRLKKLKNNNNKRQRIGGGGSGDISVTLTIPPPTETDSFWGHREVCVCVWERRWPIDKVRGNIGSEISRSSSGGDTTHTHTYTCFSLPISEHSALSSSRGQHYHFMSVCKCSHTLNGAFRGGQLLEGTIKIFTE